MKDFIISSKDWNFSTPYQPSKDAAEATNDNEVKKKRVSHKQGTSNNMTVVPLTTLLKQTVGRKRSTI
jgi:hypothetical protein